jgi:creatinine amidohydrolase/Fe(II)-dependent formamide hydrolase-like protein
VRAYHDFADLSESGTLGDPSLSNAEQGTRFHAAVVDELVRFIADFAGWRIPGQSQ